MERQKGKVLMRALSITSFVLALELVAAAHARQISQADSSMSTANDLMLLGHLANEAHEKGEIKEEIEYRRNYSQMGWAANPTSRAGSVNRWLIVYTNDMPLAILLEGTHEWAEAEAVYRHNQTALEGEAVAGDDVKSANELHLAHLLAREGRQKEAREICAFWEKRVKRIGQALDDSPETETGAWDLACGRTEEGMRLLKQQMAAHPRMLAPYTVVSEYSIAEGDFEKGRRAETDGVWAVLGEGPAMEKQVADSERELH